MPFTIKQVLKEWGCTWMRKSLWITGDDNWIRGAIEGGTLVAVTDGSYIKERYPSLCSAAFVLECSKKVDGCLVPLQNGLKEQTPTKEN